MQLSFLKQGVALLLSVFPIMLQPALAWEDNYNYNRGWNQQNYYYQTPESIEYNGRIIRTGIRPNSDICSLVIQILGHCDGYIGFNESTRTHIFRNDSHQQYYPNNPSGYEHYDNIPDQNQCVVNILGVGLICPQR